VEDDIKCKYVDILYCKIATDYPALCPLYTDLDWCFDSVVAVWSWRASYPVFENQKKNPSSAQTTILSLGFL